MNDKLARQLEEIRHKNEEVADKETWTPESLCYMSFNILQEFKVNN